jgi:hypothetical protein
MWSILLKNREEPFSTLLQGRAKRFWIDSRDSILSARTALVPATQYPSLLYLLEKHGQKVRDRVLFRIRRRKPEFGASNRALETKPQKDRINVLAHFDPSRGTFTVPFNRDC